MNVFRQDHISCIDTGSDDFYGPLCVVACYISYDDYTWLDDLNIAKVDIHDIDQIIKTGKILKDKLIYSLLLLDNSHYNQMIHAGYKMSQIKTNLYNHALINVMQRVNKAVDTKVIYSFLSPKKYYKNLKYKTLVVSHLLFEKDYQKYIGLKCAKILSEYAYYQYFRNMNNTLKISIPHGNNKVANEVGITLVNQYGKDILNKVSKTNMPNYKQILEKF